MTQQRADDAASAAQRWAEALAAWAIPEDILTAAPEWPHGFDVGLFARIADEAMEEDTPSHRVAREALPRGGSVLDVACGAGAGSLPLAPPAGLLVGLDESAGMLEAFADRADARGVRHREVAGRWPDVADQAPAADVVVAHNVFYNVADLVPFVRRLADHARVRVVAELTERHPLSWLNPYWQHLHGLDRPERPTAEDAAAVVREAGFGVAVERWDRPMHAHRTGEELVAFVRKRLCVGPERDRQIRELVERYPPPATRAVATLWWSPAPS